MKKKGSLDIVLDSAAFCRSVVDLTQGTSCCESRIQLWHGRDVAGIGAFIMHLADGQKVEQRQRAFT
jgi:hypothetical protein